MNSKAKILLLLFILSTAHAQLEPMWTMEDVKFDTNLEYPKIYDDILVAVLDDRLNAWKITSGQILWKTDIQIQWFQVHKGIITGVDTSSLDFTALDIKTGAVIWKVSSQLFLSDLAHQMQETPQIQWRFYEDNVVILPNGGSRIVVLDVLTGDVVWLGWAEPAGFHYRDFYYNDSLFTIYNKMWGARSPGGFYVFDISQKAIIFDSQPKEVKMTSDHVRVIDGKVFRFSPDNTVGEVDIADDKRETLYPSNCSISGCESSYTSYSVNANTAPLVWSAQLPFSLWQDGREGEFEIEANSPYPGYIRENSIAWYVDSLWILNGESKSLHQFSPLENTWSQFSLPMCDTKIMFVKSLPNFLGDENSYEYLFCEYSDTSIIYSLSEHTFTTFPVTSFLGPQYISDNITVFVEQQEVGELSSLNIYDSQTGVLKMSLELNRVSGWLAVDDFLIVGMDYSDKSLTQVFDLTP